MNKIYKCDCCKSEIGLPGPYFLKYPDWDTGELHSAQFCTFTCLKEWSIKMERELKKVRRYAKIP
jgi:hypothetical protein